MAMQPFTHDAHDDCDAPRRAAHDGDGRDGLEGGLPMLQLRGVHPARAADERCASLLALLTTEEVTRFISPPPTTLRRLRALHSVDEREREAGRYLCFAVVPDGYDTAVGLFQVRQLDPTFDTAEWGFAHGVGVLGLGAVHARALRLSWRSRSTSSACTGSRRERRFKTAAAMAHCGRLAQCRRAS